MQTVLCTLYNSLYLDKGLVMYDSLKDCCSDFILYVLCMDDKCYDVLSDIDEVSLVPIRLCDFEKGDLELLKAKSNRSGGEYCWTCTPSLIRYIIREYKHEICTYIDADLYFYSDPQILVDEMLAAGKSVMVTPHMFPKKSEKQAQKVGIYCVEFNTFSNSEDSFKALEYWRARCLECCSNLDDGVHWGDQKYLEELVQKFNCIHVCQNKGAGVAPWNIMLYKQSDRPFVFYHFQSVRYVSRFVINTNLWTTSDIDLSLVDQLYYPYLRKIEDKKCLLETFYSISFLINHHPVDMKISKWRKGLRWLDFRKVLFVIRARIYSIHPYLIDISK